MRSSLAAVALVAALATAACSGASSDAAPIGGGDDVNAPLPTIGLGSDVGRISGGADVRAIDTGAIEEIVMIGDSITVGAQPMIDEQFTALGFQEVTIVAQELKRIGQTFRGNPSGVEIARFLAAEPDHEADERLWVVALGTNDISQYGGADDVVPVIDALLEPIPDEAPLIWINTYFGSRPEDTADVNEAIETAIRARGNAVVAQWNEIAPIDGVLRSDGVHPNTEGAKIFAAFVTTTVSDFIQR